MAYGINKNKLCWNNNVVEPILFGPSDQPQMGDGMGGFKKSSHDSRVPSIPKGMVYGLLG